MEETFYEILGIEPGSDLDEIKRAYRSLARKYHPDGNNPDASDLLFRRVSEAYSTLSSSERRERYDATLGIEDGHTPEDKKKTRSYVFDPEVEDSQGRSSDPPPGKTSGRTAGKSSGSQSVKSSGRFARRPDGKTSTTEEAEQDSDSILGKLTRAFIGTRNSGSSGRPSGIKNQGASADSEADEELDLRGDRVYQFTINGLESLTGTTRELALRTDEVPRMIRVKVPPGVSDGDILRIKVANEGEELNLPIRITISPHEFVEREGRDIVLNMPLTFGESLSGVELDIPTLTGPVRVRVPALWDVRKRLRVKERGIHREGSEPGDLYVQLRIFCPDLEPPQVREIATALDASYSSHPRNKFPTKFK